MGKAVDYIVFLGLLAVVGGLVGVYAQRARRQRQLRNARWEMQVHRDRDALGVGRVEVCLEHPVEGRLEIGTACVTDRDFEDRVAELRSEASYKMAALNTGRGK